METRARLRCRHVVLVGLVAISLGPATSLVADDPATPPPASKQRETSLGGLILSAFGVGTQTAKAEQGTHRTASDIVFKGPHKLRDFFVAPDGHLVAVTGPATSYGANVEDAKQSSGEVHVYSPEGKPLRNWPLDFVPQTVTVGADGAIFVAGAGQVARFDIEGKKSFSQASPHLAIVLKNPDELRASAEEQLKEQTEQYEQLLKQHREQVAALTEKDAKELSKEEQQTVRLLKAQLKQFEQMAQQVKKQSADDLVRQIQAQVADIRAIAISAQDIFLATHAVKGYGFVVWRMGHDLSEPKQVISDLAGCCGQMDIQCQGSDVLVAENSRHRVVRYDRDGKRQASWGKADRSGSGGGFGGCCNPMNLCFAGGDVLTAESEGPVKRFTAEGKFVELIGSPTVQLGCKNVAIAASPDAGRVYFYDQNKSRIIVLAKAQAEEASKAATP